MRFNGFIFFLLLAIVVAWLFPQGPQLLPLSTFTDIGIGLIFLFYGLKLSPAQFKTGFRNYKAHLLIQGSTFILFPLLALTVFPLFEGGRDSEVWLALFFLGALPSTVSSSVVMVSLARGNIPTAIFNASISGLIGIVVTPLWMGLFLSASNQLQPESIIFKFFIQIILPLIIGLLLQRPLAHLARKYNRQLGLFDQSIIVLIVYTSFSNSFASDLFKILEITELVKLFLIVLAMFFVVFFFTGWITRLLGFPVEDRIAVQFCGTKKSLVHGSVMGKVIFGNSASLGLMLLPIMLYHISQLLLIAVVAERYRRQNTL